MAHPENTMRALKDQLLFVERWRCGFGWHRWSKWSDPGHISTRVYIQQKRTCVDCGRVHVKNIKGSA